MAMTIQEEDSEKKTESENSQEDANKKEKKENNLYMKFAEALLRKIKKQTM